MPAQGAPLVLDVTGGNLQPGAAVVCWTKNNPASANQLWSTEPSCLS